MTVLHGRVVLSVQPPFVASVEPTRPLSSSSLEVQPLQSGPPAEWPVAVVFVQGDDETSNPSALISKKLSRPLPLIRSAQSSAITSSFSCWNGPELAAWLNRVLGDPVLVESHAR